MICVRDKLPLLAGRITQCTEIFVALPDELMVSAVYVEHKTLQLLGARLLQSIQCKQSKSFIFDDFLSVCDV